MTTTLETCARQLEVLLETENAALERMDVEAVAALTAEKRRLVGLLRELISRTAAAAADVQPSQIHRLTRVADDNKALLERSMLVQRRLMAIVASAARPATTGYARSGAATNIAAAQPRAIIARA